MDFSKERLVVYTVITGGYDYLKEPEYIMDNCDYICFTDNPKLTSKVWDIRVVEPEESMVRTQRQLKILTHRILPEYTWSIYIDGNVRIIGDFRKYMEAELEDEEILCLKHPNRISIYEEAQECINLKKDNPEVILRQVAQYRKEGYPENSGLVVSNVLVRKHASPRVIELMELWWKQLQKYSFRDQLSFNYCCWKLGIKYAESELKPWRSPYWLNPGIHTDQLFKIETELIDHIQLDAFREYQLLENEKQIKELCNQLDYANAVINDQKRELNDTRTELGWKKQELEDARTELGWKKQELEDAMTELGWKKQELEDARTELGWKKQELEDSRQSLFKVTTELNEIYSSRVWKVYKKIKNK
ncbi:MAG: DUF616 domain-containing protein [Lachnospiraceae bacterium]|nr:DUF616 domain-containing protein [Lachnospiraceae bacterium]